MVKKIKNRYNNKEKYYDNKLQVAKYWQKLYNIK